MILKIIENVTHTAADNEAISQNESATGSASVSDIGTKDAENVKSLDAIASETKRTKLPISKTRGKTIGSGTVAAKITINSLPTAGKGMCVTTGAAYVDTDIGNVLTAIQNLIKSSPNEAAE